MNPCMLSMPWETCRHKETCRDCEKTPPLSPDQVEGCGLQPQREWDDVQTSRTSLSLWTEPLQLPSTPCTAPLAREPTESPNNPCKKPLIPPLQKSAAQYARKEATTRTSAQPLRSKVLKTDGILPFASDFALSAWEQVTSLETTATTPSARPMDVERCTLPCCTVLTGRNCFETVTDPREQPSDQPPVPSVGYSGHIAQVYHV